MQLKLFLASQALFRVDFCSNQGCEEPSKQRKTAAVHCTGSLHLSSSQQAGKEQALRQGPLATDAVFIRLRRDSQAYAADFPARLEVTAAGSPIHTRVCISVDDTVYPINVDSISKVLCSPSIHGCLDPAAQQAPCLVAAAAPPPPAAAPAAYLTLVTPTFCFNAHLDQPSADGLHSLARVAQALILLAAPSEQLHQGRAAHPTSAAVVAASPSEEAAAGSGQQPSPPATQASSGSQGRLAAAAASSPPAAGAAAGAAGAPAGGRLAGSKRPAPPPAAAADGSGMPLTAKTKTAAMGPSPVASTLCGASAQQQLQQQHHQHKPQPHQQEPHGNSQQQLDSCWLEQLLLEVQLLEQVCKPPAAASSLPASTTGSSSGSQVLLDHNLDALGYLHLAASAVSTWQPVL